jgi:hypothetical protein
MTRPDVFRSTSHWYRPPIGMSPAIGQRRRPIVLICRPLPWRGAPLRRQPATASIENQQSLDGYSIYEARAVAPGLVFCFSAAISVFAAGPEECGFCPVISMPSLTT